MEPKEVCSDAQQTMPEEGQRAGSGGKPDDLSSILGIHTVKGEPMCAAHPHPLTPVTKQTNEQTQFRRERICRECSWQAPVHPLLTALTVTCLPAVSDRLGLPHGRTPSDTPSKRSKTQDADRVISHG